VTEPTLIAKVIRCAPRPCGIAPKRQYHNYPTATTPTEIRMLMGVAHVNELVYMCNNLALPSRLSDEGGRNGQDLPYGMSLCRRVAVADSCA
jgi:hypothetical protein